MLLIRDRRDLDLVITGEHGPDTGVLIGRIAAAGLLDRARLPGFVPRSDLIALYRGAAALVYPSLAEGFGLPVIEAMTCGVPVIAASSGALPEVGGDACLYVRAGDAEMLAGTIASLLDDAGRASRLSREGMARASRFSWRETARRTFQVYREVAS